MRLAHPAGRTHANSRCDHHPNLFASLQATNEHDRRVTIPAGTIISGLIHTGHGYRFRAKHGRATAVYSSPARPETMPA